MKWYDLFIPFAPQARLIHDTIKDYNSNTPDPRTTDRSLLDSEYLSEYDSNPYTVQNRKSWIDSLGHALGLRTAYDNAEQERITAMNKYDADLLARQQINIWNSEEEVAKRQTEAGINPNFQNISGSPAAAPTGVESPEGAPANQELFDAIGRGIEIASGFGNIASTCLNMYSTLKQLPGVLSGLDLTNEVKRTQNIQEISSLLKPILPMVYSSNNVGVLDAFKQHYPDYSDVIDKLYQTYTESPQADIDLTELIGNNRKLVHDLTGQGANSSDYDSLTSAENTVFAKESVKAAVLGKQLEAYKTELQLIQEQAFGEEGATNEGYLRQQTSKIMRKVSDIKGQLVQSIANMYKSALASGDPDRIMAMVAGIDNGLLNFDPRTMAEFQSILSQTDMNKVDIELKKATFKHSVDAAKENVEHLKSQTALNLERHYDMGYRRKLDTAALAADVFGDVLSNITGVVKSKIPRIIKRMK